MNKTACTFSFFHSFNSKNQNRNICNTETNLFGHFLLNSINSLLPSNPISSIYLENFEFKFCDIKYDKTNVRKTKTEKYK